MILNEIIKTHIVNEMNNESLTSNPNEDSLMQTRYIVINFLRFNV